PALLPPGTEPLTGLIDRTARLIEAARAAGMPVIHTAQRGGQTPAQRGLQLDFWGPGVPADPAAHGSPERVAPAGDDIRLTKWKYSAFARTDLEERLRAAGRDQLVVTGVYAHIGVLMTAADAWSRDLRAFVAADAVADFSREDHDMALRWAAGRCARVAPTADLLKEF
ncbi:isochorismatase family protein, partial [Streptomyces sp. SA3_actF]|uniref:isochorismatase family protein n=1 Tax=Streptomyces sp. SA3_actF TaxID=682181 RepID=UPI0002000E0F